MKLKVMCHRPRTQRIGPQSRPQELHIFTGEESEAKEVISDVRKAYREMINGGDFLPGGEAHGFQTIPGGEAHGFQTIPNDKFYLKVVE